MTTERQDVALEDLAKVLIRRGLRSRGDRRVYETEFEFGLDLLLDALERARVARAG